MRGRDRRRMLHVVSEAMIVLLGVVVALVVDESRETAARRRDAVAAEVRLSYEIERNLEELRVSWAQAVILDFEAYVAATEVG